VIDLHFSPMARHSPRFVQLCEQARSRVREISVDELKARLDRGEAVNLIDVREESEWAQGRLPQSTHLGKGVIERDIEARVPDTAAPLVLYCGGGYRSALAADNLQRMGYTNVLSLAGGWRGWNERGYPVER
jgi:rhodanese-related sulfurtransferase